MRPGAVLARPFARGWGTALALPGADVPGHFPKGFLRRGPPGLPGSPTFFPILCPVSPPDAIRTVRGGTRGERNTSGKRAPLATADEEQTHESSRGLEAGRDERGQLREAHA